MAVSKKTPSRKRRRLKEDKAEEPVQNDAVMEDGVEEEKDEAPPGNGGAYFPATRKDADFIHSGSTLLDCVLGGGWPLGRVSNIVGDKASAKTLLAIEAMANMNLQFPEGNIWYAEAEAAFDQDYAESLGLPVDNVNFVEDFLTVEDLFESLEEICQQHGQERGLYIVDSLDALSDRSEQERDIDEGTYGAAKAKKMSEMFRRLIRPVKHSNIHLMFISQIRDKMNVGFGKKTSRSGGRALDFYASQILEVAHKKRMEKTRKGVKRKIGVEIEASCEKNKIGMPFRSCDFEVRFGYGIDDLKSCLVWLVQTKNLDEIGLTSSEASKIMQKTMSMPEDEFQRVYAKVRDTVPRIWAEIDQGLMPKRRKYG